MLSVIFILAILIGYSLAVSYKIKHVITLYTTIALIGMNPRIMELYVHIKTGTQMCIAVLFVRTQNRKESRGPSAGKRMGTSNPWNTAQQ